MYIPTAKIDYFSIHSKCAWFFYRHYIIFLHVVLLDEAMTVSQCVLKQEKRRVQVYILC